MYLERFEQLVKETHKRNCPCCGQETTYEKVQKSMAYMTVYGMTIEEIARVRDFAEQHGYKSIN